MASTAKSAAAPATSPRTMSPDSTCRSPSGIVSIGRMDLASGVTGGTTERRG